MMLLQLVLASVAALASDGPPRWDRQHPDKNPGARVLVAGSPAADRPASGAAVERTELFELSVGASAVSKGGQGLLLRGGRAERGSVLLENALSVGGQPAKLLTFRALSSLNHCWRPNARLLRRRRGGDEVVEAAVTGEDDLPVADVIYDLVAIEAIDGLGAGEAGSEVLIDYSSTPGFIEGPRSAWKCPGPTGELRYSLDEHHRPSALDAATFSRWVTIESERDTIVLCGNSGPDGRSGMATSGKLPHCAAGLLHSVYRPRPNGLAVAAGPAATAESLFMRSQKPPAASGKRRTALRGGLDLIPQAKTGRGKGTVVDPRQLFIARSGVHGKGVFTRRAISAGATILPLAIEAGSRANGDVRSDIYTYAAQINHCWSGNTYARSEAADLTVDGGLGSYYQFSVVALVDIEAGAELFTDYRLAPWFVQQPVDKWSCPGAERVEGQVAATELNLLPWEVAQ